MYQVKINDVNYDVPQSIEDVTIGNFIKFRNTPHTDELQVLYWAIGAKPIFRHTDTIEAELSNVFALFNPVKDEIYAFLKSVDKMKVPDTIEVLGVTVNIKQGLLNDLPYWPYVVTKNIVLQEGKKDPFDPTDRMPEVLAHYLYSVVTKSPYDEAKANDFIEVANDINMVPAIQLANFFLLRHSDLFPLSKKSLAETLKKISKRQG